MECSRIWPQLDDSLCQLVDQLESGIRLEVEFQALNATPWWGGKHGFKKYLPRSYEKGVTCGVLVDDKTAVTKPVGLEFCALHGVF